MNSLLILLLVIVAVKASPDELRLLNNLVSETARSDVVKMLRPVENFGDAVDVDFGFSLLGISHAGVPSTTVKVWAKVSWNDSYLQWEPSEYGSITQVNLMADRIWTPDIMHYKEPIPMDWNSVLAVVQSTGAVLTVVPVEFNMDCSVSEDEPESNEHGRQYECTAKFGSWTYDGSRIDLRDAGFDLSLLSDEHIHDAEGTAVREAVKYEGWPETFVDILFTLRFRYDQE